MIWARWQIPSGLCLAGSFTGIRISATGLEFAPTQVVEPTRGGLMNSVLGSAKALEEGVL